MTVLEIENQIRPLSSADKIHLIQSIPEMLKENENETLLRQLKVSAECSETRSLGPLEAYDAAKQLQDLLKQEST